MNPQNLAFLFITHDFGLYRWSSLFYAWHFCLAVITHRVLSSFHFLISVHYSHSPRYMQCPTLIIFLHFSSQSSIAHSPFFFLFFFFSPRFLRFYLSLASLSPINEINYSRILPTLLSCMIYSITSTFLSPHLRRRWKSICLWVSSSGGIFACIRVMLVHWMHLLSDLILRVQSIPCDWQPCSLPEFVRSL